MQLDVLEAKTQFSRLIEAVENGREREIVITRGGKPVVRLVSLEPPRPRIQLGLCDGEFAIPDPDDPRDLEIARMFMQGMDVFPEPHAPDPQATTPGEVVPLGQANAPRI